MVDCCDFRCFDSISCVFSCDNYTKSELAVKIAQTKKSFYRYSKGRQSPDQATKSSSERAEISPETATVARSVKCAVLVKVHSLAVNHPEWGSNCDMCLAIWK